MTETEDFFASAPPPSDEDPLRSLLIAMVENRDQATPRHLQKTLGASDIGHPCLRRMAYGLTQATATNPEFDPLPSIIGTATHTWLSSAASHANLVLGRTRFLTETKVRIADGLGGTADLYDCDTGTVVDWKDIKLETPIPTPSGWTTMADIRPGDQVFDISGKPVDVIGVSPVWTDRDCAEITFEDGETVTCSTSHEWVVQWGQDAVERIMSTLEMAQKLRDPKGQSQIRIANTAPLSLPDIALPIEPYVLGAWLGDGNRDSGCIGKPDQELFDNIIATGHFVTFRKPRADGLLLGRVVGLTRTLRQANLIGNKHIPPIYLRAGHTQRLALLQGLMDTDGTWNKTRNQAVFSNNDKRLIDAVAELISTLGWKPRIWELQKHGFGRTITSYDLSFVPFGDNPFRLSRKADLVRTDGTTRSQRRFIRSIEPVATTLTRCITVDSPSQTFLCTEAMIPTHNCPGANRFKIYRKHIGPTYRAQVHLYGRGLENAGREVKRVAIALLPRGGLLRSLHLWSEDYNPELADAVLARRDAVVAMLADFDTANNPETYSWFPIEPYDCVFCPYFSPRPRGPLQCKGDQ